MTKFLWLKMQVTTERLLKFIRKRATPVRYHSVKSCNTSSVLTQQEESCPDPLVSPCAHWGFSYQYQNAEIHSSVLKSQLAPLALAGRAAFYFLTVQLQMSWKIKDCSLFCDLWSSHIPTLKNYPALIFLPCLLPTFSWFGAQQKAAQAAGPDPWSGILGICWLTSRTEDEFSSFFPKRGVQTTALFCI